MILRRTLSILLVAMALLATACGPEAKKKKALEGGNRYFDKGQYKQARLMYLSAVKTDPRFGEAYYKLALTNLRLGNPAEAAGNLQRAVELQPENLDAHSKLADIYLAAYLQNPSKFKPFLKDIKDLADRLAKRGKGSFEELRLNGYLALSEGKGEEGLAFFEQANKLKPNQVPLEMTMVRTLVLLKRTDEAIAMLKAVQNRDKTLDMPYDMLYAIYVAQGKFDEAEKVLIDRAANNPKESANRLRLAQHYLALKKPELMEKVLEETLQRTSDFPNAFREVGDYYYRIRSFDRAASTYEEGKKREPANARVFDKRIVEVRVAQSRSQEALDLVEAILKEDPKDPEAIAMRASLWLYAGKPEQINMAISELQSVVSKMPDNFVLRYNLGRALMTKGDLDGAKVQFIDALKFRPEYIPAGLALAQVYLAKKEYSAAQSTANDILRVDPNNQFARLIHSQAFLAVGKYTESKAVLADTLKLNPGQRDAKYQLGFVLFQEKKFKEAEVQFQEIYSMQPPDMRGLLGLTEIYTATNKPEKALALLESEMERYPKVQSLKVAWANTAARSGRQADAVNMYRKVLETDPKNFDVTMRLAEVLRASDQLPAAIEAWKSAASILPNSTKPMLFRAMALDAVNRRSEAAPLYEQVLKLEPDNVIALNNFSFYLAEQGTDLNLALSYAQKAKARAPDDASIADTLGFVYLKKNLPENAASIFGDLAGKYPKVAMFHIRLATAYLQQGQREKAKRALDDAKRNNPSKTEVSEIEKLASRLG